MRVIVVFPDGETWSEIEGCTVRIVDEESFYDLVDDRLDADETQAEVFDLSAIFREHRNGA